MTVFEVYQKGLELLKSHQIEDALIDCDLLFADAVGKDRFWRRLHRDDTMSLTSIDVFFQNIERRLQGEPLQYILGLWSFFGRDFFVGEGVLIPRPETEELVERANKILKDKPSAVVYDLCAGSGAIGLTVALENPNTFVYLFEKYDAAFSYLQKNLDALGVRNAKAIQADILNFPFETLKQQADLLLSNPPYIPSAELKTLQKEVQKEPQTALDGGKDGLLFYKAIKESWLPFVNANGTLLFECGNEQGNAIAELFSNDSVNQKIIYDFNAVDRIVEINV